MIANRYKIINKIMFERAFKNLDDELRKDSGCSTELDYIEQTSWVLFLKYLDDLETERESYAKLKGEKYNRILKKEFSWSVWAAPKTSGGKLDFNKVLDGDDLNDFANQKLIPYLKTFKSGSEFKPDTIEYKIGEIFSELKNKLQSGYTLRKIINIIDELRFKSNDEKDELSSLYEDKIKNPLRLAKKINPKNPRIYLLEANIQQKLPFIFGGGCKSTKPLIQQAERLLNTQNILPYKLISSL